MENDIPVLTSAELEAVDLPEGAGVEGTDMRKPARTRLPPLFVPSFAI